MSARVRPYVSACVRACVRAHTSTFLATHALCVCVCPHAANDMLVWAHACVRHVVCCSCTTPVYVCVWATVRSPALSLCVCVCVQVALKFLSKENLLKRQTRMVRVKREIRILKLLHHPHIVRLYEVAETATEIILTLEYAGGGELFDYIVAQSRLREREARHIFRQVRTVPQALCERERGRRTRRHIHEHHKQERTALVQTDRESVHVCFCVGACVRHPTHRDGP
jgi:serine/threonine protein kinase